MSTNCKHCGKPLDVKVQRIAKLGYEYDIATCWNMECPRYAFTFASPKRPIAPEPGKDADNE